MSAVVECACAVAPGCVRDPVYVEWGDKTGTRVGVGVSLLRTATSRCRMDYIMPEREDVGGIESLNAIGIGLRSGVSMVLMRWLGCCFIESSTRCVSYPEFFVCRARAESGCGGVSGGLVCQ